MRRVRTVFLCCLALTGACSSDPALTGVDVPRDALTDRGVVAPDAPDAPTDAGLDAAADVPRDALLDVPADLPRDAPADVPGDAPTDAPADVPRDAPTDAPADVPRDAPTDAPADVPGDAPTDVPADASAEGGTSTYVLGAPFADCNATCGTRGLTCAGSGTVGLECGQHTATLNCSTPGFWIYRVHAGEAIRCLDSWGTSDACSNNYNLDNAFCCHCR